MRVERFLPSIAIAVGVILPTARDLSAQAGQNRSVLHSIDSVTVDESSTQVNRVGEIAVSITRTYVSDPGEWRVLEVSRQGKVTRRFGRRGKGPGEFETPGSLVVAGDELMVMDYSLRRVNVYSLGTGKFVRSFLLNAFLPSLVFRGNELYAASFDEARRTSLIRMSPNGELLGREGAIPAVAERLPMLLQPFPHQALAVEPTSVHMMSELSNSLYSWPRGGGPVTERSVPVRARRGVREAQFEEMVRNPQKAGAIAYDHSVPVAMSVVGSGVLAIVSYDPVVTQGRFSGQHHLTIVDINSRRACPDVVVPAPAEPLARMALEGSRLTIVQQVVVGGDAATTIRRLRIDPSACQWVPMR